MSAHYTFAVAWDVPASYEAAVFRVAGRDFVVVRLRVVEPVLLLERDFVAVVRRVRARAVPLRVAVAERVRGVRALALASGRETSTER